MDINECRLYRRPITCALALALLSASSGAQRSSRTGPSPQSHPHADALAEAEGLLQKQQYAEAEQKLTDMVSDAAKDSQQENPQAWFDLGFAQNHLNKTNEAVASYRKAVQLSPRWFEANLNLGVTLARLNDFPAATPVLQRAVTLKPTAGGNTALSKAWQTLAEVLEKSDPKASAAAYDKAAELDPTQTVLTLGAGRMLQTANDLPGAEEHFKKSAETGDPQGMVMLINLLSQEKRYPEAETWLSKYVEKNPQDNKARLELGKFLGSQGKLQEAIAVLQVPGPQLDNRQTTAPPSSNPEIERELAELYLQTKQYGLAEPLFSTSGTGQCSQPGFAFWLGRGRFASAQVC